MRTLPQPSVAEVAVLRPWWWPLLALAPHDYVILAYLLYLLSWLGTTPSSTRRDHLLLGVLGILCVFLAVSAAVRAVPRPGWRSRGILRIVPLLSILIPYGLLSSLIPLVHPALYDTPLYRLDLLVLRFEPAVALERITTPWLVEWLSGWYALYWVIIGLFVLAQVFLPVEPRRGGRFATSIVALTCAGHALYVLVPGVGPYMALAHQCAGPLPGGPVYEFMLRVASNGAQRDIFPSLHTAHMVFLTLFCWRESAVRAYRWLRWPVTVAAVHVVAATLFLRWHYVIDVIVGVALAIAAHKLAHAVNPRYERLRSAFGLTATWW